MSFDSMAKKIAVGDEKTFEKLYNSLYRIVFSICYSITKSEAIANDLSQETFVTVWNNSCRVNGKGYKTWILTIARNKSLNYIKKYGKEIAVDFSESENYLNNENNHFDLEKQIILKNAIENLSQQDREIVLLKNAGLKHREIAEYLGIPSGTVSWRYSEAIKILKKQVEV